MSFLPALSSSELSRFLRNWLGRLALLAVIAVPSLYGGLLVWSNRDVTTHLSGMRAAVVNEDEMVTVEAGGKKQPVMVGRLVAGRLTGSTDHANLDWELTDAEAAQKGLDDGTYYAVLTIPKGFSAAAVSPQDAKTAREATMDLRTNDAISYLSGNIAASVGRVVAQQTGTQLSEQYLDKVYLGFNTVKTNLTKAGDGAGKLADGAGKLADGADTLDDGAGKLTVALTELARGADRLAAGTGDLSGGLGTLASGATGLASGAGKVADGNAQLSGGLSQIAAGTTALPDQSRQLAEGGHKVADGAQALGGGATKLAGGLDTLKTKTAPLPGQVRQLADGAGKIRDGANKLAAGGAALAPAARQLTTGAAGLSDAADKIAAGGTALGQGTTQLRDATGRLADGASKAANGVAAYTGGVDKLAAACASSGADSRYCAQLAAVAEKGSALREGSATVAGGATTLAESVGPLAAGAQGLSKGVQDYAAGAQKFADGATKYAAGAGQVAAGAQALGTGATPLAAGLDRMADGMPQLVGGIDAAAKGAHQLAGGSDQLATGANSLAGGLDKLAAAAPKLATGVSQASSASKQLADGSAKVSQGADKLAGGASSAASGSKKLDAGAHQLADGAGKTRDGAQKLSDGATDLATGAHKLADGTDDLAGGLKEGAAKAPSYTEAERDRLGRVVAQPVVADVARQNAVPSYGHGLAPYFMSIGLWVGAMGMFFLLSPLPKRAIASTAASWRVALAGFAGPALLGTIQAIVQILVVHLWVGIEVANLPALYALAILTSLAFVAINQALVASLGTKGRFAALILVVLQLSAAGATYPIESSPRFFQVLHGWLPLTHGVAAFRALIAGGGLDLAPHIAVLLAWIIGAGLVSFVAAHAQRTWTPQRLRPRFAL